MDSAERVRTTLLSSFLQLPLVRGLLMLAIAVAAHGCNRAVPRAAVQVPPHEAYPSVIDQPAKLSSIESGQVDVRGNATRIACVTCHSLRPSQPLPKTMASFETFHQGIKFKHGAVPCASCHVDGQHDKLHLANGEELPLAQAMRLCGQCHGPQLRNYVHGSHGGMRGHWDLQRGPRQRNNCVDCHDPHAPRIPMVMPMPPPRDRFL